MGNILTEPVNTELPEATPTVITDNECVLAADLYSEVPEILSGQPGFDGVIGISDTTEEAAVKAGCAWNSDLDVCPISGDPLPFAARTACVVSNQVLPVYDCLQVPSYHDGFPLCFSWPVLPSSIQREHIEYTRSDGAVFHPNCISSFPNHEFNERHCIVMFDDFITRVVPEGPAPIQGGLLHMERIEIVGDIMLVGKNGELVSAKGLFRETTFNESSYIEGPKFIGWARLVPLTTDGEGSSNRLNAIGPNAANSGVDLYGDSSNLFRLRLFYSAGMTPDGVTALLPTMFGDYFSLMFMGGQTIDDTNTTVTIDGTSIRVLGLADIGVFQEDYDECYVDDRDNYIDIILEVQGDTEVLQELESVQAFHKGKFLFNPGGPGRTPTDQVTYTAPSPADQLVPVLVDLVGEWETTYCQKSTGRVSTDKQTCQEWRDRGQLQTLDFGTARQN